ncbi:MAG TPA: lysine biosynthesis protein LysX [Nitrososphaeraceae archaeon]|nr:lysine biosynthesis protein LysX [Nitrososphaeraceae archaeon]
MNKEKINTTPTPSLTILYDNIRWEEKALFEAAKKRGINVSMLDCKTLSLKLEGRNDDDILSNGTVIQRCVSYFRSIHSTSMLEGLGYRVINSFETSNICGNKLFAHVTLRKKGVKTPKAITAFSAESALTAIEEIGYPVVIKPTVGSWGRLIGLLRDRDAAEAVIESREYMFPLYRIYFFEEFVKRPPRDIRAIVIGNRVAAAIYRYSGHEEWKTNMALGGKAEPCAVTKELEDLCLKASDAVQGEIVGVDLMESDELGLMVHEVNSTTEFKNTVRVTGVDIPTLAVEYSTGPKNR